MKVVNKVQKKTATKVAPKQKVAPVVKSSRATVKKTPNVLVIAVGSTRFWVNEGPVLSHLKDLERALVSMSDAQYNYHVNKIKNDFAKWTQDILKDPKTASQLKKAKSKIEASKIVATSLSNK